MIEKAQPLREDMQRVANFIYHCRNENFREAKRLAAWFDSSSPEIFVNGNRKGALLFFLILELVKSDQFEAAKTHAMIFSWHSVYPHQQAKEGEIPFLPEIKMPKKTKQTAPEETMTQTTPVDQNAYLHRIAPTEITVPLRVRYTTRSAEEFENFLKTTVKMPEDSLALKKLAVFVKETVTREESCRRWNALTIVDSPFLFEVKDYSRKPYGDEKTIHHLQIKIEREGSTLPYLELEYSELF